MDQGGFAIPLRSVCVVCMSLVSVMYIVVKCVLCMYVVSVVWRVYCKFAPWLAEFVHRENPLREFPGSR